MLQCNGVLIQTILNSQGNLSNDLKESDNADYHQHNHDHDHCHDHDHGHDHDEHDGHNHSEHKHEDCAHQGHEHHQHNKQEEHQGHDCNGYNHHDNNDNEHEPLTKSTAESHCSDHESCQEATEKVIETINECKTPHKIKTSFQTKAANTTTPHIATEEAVEKLQQRFTQLMTQCADLTEEKQRLEHLVMQLQSETETIGEYIALYQTQRRILKQREYEKAAQTAMLQAEREQMRERLNILNNLVNRLGMETPQNQVTLKQQINEALAQNVAIDVTQQHQQSVAASELLPIANSSNVQQLCEEKTLNNDLNSPESQQILHKIQDIITEIKENTKELPTVTHTVDHLNCCSGKFEVV